MSLDYVKDIQEHLQTELQRFLKQRCNQRWEFGQHGHNERSLQSYAHVILTHHCGKVFHVISEHELAGGKRRVDFALIPRTRYVGRVPMIVIELKYIKTRCIMLNRHAASAAAIAPWRKWNDATHGKWFHSAAFAAVVLKDLDHIRTRDIGGVCVMLNRTMTTVRKHCLATERGQLRDYLRLARRESSSRVTGFVVVGVANRVYSGNVVSSDD